MYNHDRRVWNVPDTAATPRTRALAAALRRELDASTMGIREMARVLGRSHTTISQSQNGKRVPDPDDVSALLAVIGVTGKRRTEILELARHAAEPDWLAVGVPGVAQQLAGVIECERTAVQIVNWSPLLVPGLLQTPGYARAMHASDDMLAANEVDARVQLRLSRQGVLTDRKPAPASLTAVIGEPALRQVIGGRDMMIGNSDMLCDRQSYRRSLSRLSRVVKVGIQVSWGHSTIWRDPNDRTPLAQEQLQRNRRGMRRTSVHFGRYS